MPFAPSLLSGSLQLQRGVLASLRQHGPRDPWAGGQERSMLRFGQHDPLLSPAAGTNKRRIMGRRAMASTDSWYFIDDLFNDPVFFSGYDGSQIQNAHIIL